MVRLDQARQVMQRCNNRKFSRQRIRTSRNHMVYLHKMGKKASAIFWILMLTVGGRLSMSAQTPTPWAVLLCKYRDNLTNPPVPNFINLCQSFFTPAGAGTYNAMEYFQDMSGGTLDLSGSQVFGWLTLNQDSTYISNDPYQGPGPLGTEARQAEVIALAKQTARQAGVPLDNYFGVVLIFNLFHASTQGGAWEGTPGVFTGYNFVTDGGTALAGQEMGHGYGLDHSRKNGSTEDYQDAWDAMSSLNTHSDPDPNYGPRGPGLNAWNLRGRRWLNESRVWRGPGSGFSHVVQLRPLHRRELPGLLAAELPPNDGSEGHGRYLVEFRMKEKWDSGIPRSAVLVHRFEGDIGQFLGSHSYIMHGTQGQLDLVAGDRFESTASAKVEVLNIDEVNRTATVRLSYNLDRPARYVDKYYTGGTVDGSFAHPYKRITDAYNAAINGDAIFVRAADYDETFPPMNKQLMIDSYLGAATLR